MRTGGRAILALTLLVCWSAEGQTAAADPVAECSNHLRAIDAAIKAYAKANDGKPPAHLSDLHPKFLPDPAVLHCPADATPGEPFNQFFPPPWRLRDPKLPVSYLYLDSATPSPPLFMDLSPPGRLPASASVRERMERHRRNFGDSVPLLQCHHHPEFRLDLMRDGSLLQSRVPLFELDPRSYPFVLDRLAADVAAGAAAVAERWSMPATEDYLLDWIESDHPSAEREKLRSAADGLAGFADRLDPASKSAAWALAARFRVASGNYRDAHTAARRAEELLGGAKADLKMRHLVEVTRFEAGGRTGQPPVDAYLERETQRRHLPGISVAVVREGKPVYVKGFGYADLEHRVPATPDTVFRIASVTKMFVATALMMLVEEGKVALDEPVTKYLSDAPREWDGITVRHLVTHTSGLADVWDVPQQSRPAVLDGAAIVKTLAAVPPPYKPGERYEYNHGATLVGVVVERVSGKPFAQFLKERVFDPLGMKSTRVDDPRSVTPGRARNYAWDDAAGTWMNVEPLPWNISSLADGGVVSTAADLGKWDEALYGERLLKRATLAEMWRPMRLSDGSETGYGCGWQVGTFRGHRWVGHFGAGQTSAKVARFPDSKLAVIVLCNFDRGDAPRIADAIAAMYLPAESRQTEQP